MRSSSAGGVFVLVISLVISVYGEFKLTILHTNDVHARIEQASKFGARCDKNAAAANKCFGGVARRKTALDKQRKENENTVLLDGGDQFQGTTWFELYNGYEAAHFMEKLGYDAMVSKYNVKFCYFPAQSAQIHK